MRRHEPQPCPLARKPTPVSVHRQAPKWVQAKLKLGAPNDAYEQEANRVAEQVMRMPVPERVQRKCAACAAAESAGRPAPCPACAGSDVENQVRRKEVGESPTIGAPVAGKIASLASGGVPLPVRERSYFEPRFGRSLESVRIHTGHVAMSAAEAIQAKAFTHGTNIAFAAGAWQPETTDGRRLLAHELVHTVQQSSRETVRRTTYADCTSNQLTNMVLPAKNKAVEDVTTAIAALGSRPLEDKTKAALFLAFRNDDRATAEAVSEDLDDIKEGLGIGELQCEQDEGWNDMCEDQRLGYTVGPGTIHLCMNAWPGASAKLRTLNVIHEGAHAFAWMIGDLGYFDYQTCAETSSTAVLSSTSRLRTPDAYSCFVSYLVYDAGIEARSEEYRGTHLALTQSPTGVIDLNGPDAESPMFSMAGVPSHSGFQFRWMVVHPDNRRTLMRDASGPTGQYGDHPQSYIGGPSRDRLKDMGISRAEVHCRVLIQGVGDRLFTQAVEFRY